MDEKIFEKARFLGIPLEGDSAEEKLQNIANQVGLPHNSSPEDISKKLDNIYHDNLRKDGLKSLQNNQGNNLKQQENLNQQSNLNQQNNLGQQSNINKKTINQNNVQNNFPNQNVNQYNRFSKEDEKLKQKLEKSRKIFQQAVNAQQQEKEEKTNGIKQKAAKKGLQALGIPSSLANLLSKEVSKDNGGTPNITSAVIQSSGPIIIGVLVVGLIILISVLSIVGLVNEDDLSAFNSTKEVHGYITSDLITDEELSEKLVELSICSRNTDKEVQTEECMNSNAGKFITHFKELYEKYKQYKDINGEEIELDVPLLLETISYNRTDSELFDPNNFSNIIEEMDTLADAMIEKYQERGDLYSIESYTVWSNGKKELKKRCAAVQNDVVVKAANGTTVYYRISDDKYISYLKYGKVHENFSGKVKVYDVDIHPSSDSTCIPSGRMYKSSDVVRYSGITSNTTSSSTTDGTTDNTGNTTTNSTNVKTQEITISIPGLSGNYKIAWVSDLHLISSSDRATSDTAVSRYNNDFYTSGTHSDEWLPQIVSYLNNGGFDAVIFGGDMVDQGTIENIKLFKEYYDQINISNKMYIRADHDYLSDLYGEAGDQNTITSTSDLYSFSLGNVLFIGIDYSNKDLSESAYNDLINKINNASNVVIATHVPYESKTTTTLRDKSFSLRNRLYYWQSEDSNAAYYFSNGSNTNMNQYLNNYIYNNSKIKYVLAGHMHGDWNGSISTLGLKQQIFNPAFNGYVGVINLVPS